LNDNKKDSQFFRSECATLEHQSTEYLNDSLKEKLEDINNLEKDFRKSAKLFELNCILITNKVREGTV
jgi:hypothetical protein